MKYTIALVCIAALAVNVAMSFKVEVINSPKTLVGTRTHWDAEKQSLYYCDVYGNESSLLRYDFNEDKVYTAGIDGENVVPFVIPVDNTVDQFAVGLGKRVGLVNWDGKSAKAALDSIVFEVEKDKNTRFNAAKSDPSGRLYAGTMLNEKTADVFANAGGQSCVTWRTAVLRDKYAKGDGAKELLDNIFISNGMAWDETANKFYYIDSGKFDLKGYDYDPSTGAVSNEKVIIDFSKNGKNPGYLPDGLTIDTDGNLYVTFYGGSKVSKVDPKTGQVLLEIPFPVKQVTACSFGGPNLDILYVITAANDDTESEHAGRLFKVTELGTKGFPGVKVKV